MTQNRIIMIIILLLAFTVWGCVGGAPHISVDRGPGDAGNPTGTPENPFLPPLAENTQIAGGGSALSESDHFKSYGGTVAASGGTTTGDRYRSVAPSLSLGAQKIGGKKK